MQDLGRRNGPIRVARRKESRDGTEVQSFLNSRKFTQNPLHQDRLHARAHATAARAPPKRSPVRSHQPPASAARRRTCASRMHAFPFVHTEACEDAPHNTAHTG